MLFESGRVCVECVRSGPKKNKNTGARGRTRQSEVANQIKKPSTTTRGRGGGFSRGGFSRGDVSCQLDWGGLDGEEVGGREGGRGGGEGIRESGRREEGKGGGAMGGREEGEGEREERKGRSKTRSLTVGPPRCPLPSSSPPFPSPFLDPRPRRRASLPPGALLSVPAPAFREILRATSLKGQRQQRPPHTKKPKRRTPEPLMPPPPSLPSLHPAGRKGPGGGGGRNVRA